MEGGYACEVVRSGGVKVVYGERCGFVRCVKSGGTLRYVVYGENGGVHGCSACVRCMKSGGVGVRCVRSGHVGVRCVRSGGVGVRCVS